MERLYPYGLSTGDTLVTTTSSLTGELVSHPIPVLHGLAVAGGQLMDSLVVRVIRVILHTCT